MKISSYRHVYGFILETPQVHRLNIQPLCYLKKTKHSLAWGKPGLSFWGIVNLMRTVWLCKLQGIIPENVCAPASEVWLSSLAVPHGKAPPRRSGPW